MAETKQIPDVSSAIDLHAVTVPVSHPITIELRVRLQALAIPEPDGRYSIVVPALPGCVSEADTIEEAQANGTEAAEGWLEVQHDRLKAEALRTARGE